MNDEQARHRFTAAIWMVHPSDVDIPLTEQEVRRLLDTLTPRERLVTVLRFGFAYDGDAPVARTLAGVGQEVGVTRERVRQIEDRVLGRLRTQVMQSLEK